MQRKSKRLSRLINFFRDVNQLYAGKSGVSETTRL